MLDFPWAIPLIWSRNTFFCHLPFSPPSELGDPQITPTSPIFFSSNNPYTFISTPFLIYDPSVISYPFWQQPSSLSTRTFLALGFLNSGPSPVYFSFLVFSPKTFVRVAHKSVNQLMHVIQFLSCHICSALSPASGSFSLLAMFPSPVSVGRTILVSRIIMSLNKAYWFSQFLGRQRLLFFCLVVFQKVSAGPPPVLFLSPLCEIDRCYRPFLCLHNLTSFLLCVKRSIFFFLPFPF